MASIQDSENAVVMLERLRNSLEEEIPKLSETTNMETKTLILKKLQLEIFQAALKLPVFEVKVH